MSNLPEPHYDGKPRIHILGILILAAATGFIVRFMEPAWSGGTPLMVGMACLFWFYMGQGVNVE